MAKTVFHPAGERGHVNHGWLDTYHSFSFASWYDPTKVHFGMLRVLNDDTVAGGMGFGKHPHDNMEIITVVIKGALEHKDSMGHTESIHVDEVQVMSAGTGLTHSEYNHNHNEPVELFQIWIFPEKKMVTPRYEQKYFLKEGRNNQLQTLVAPIDTDGPELKIHQQAWVYRTNLCKGNSVETILHTKNHGLYIFVIEGRVSIGGKELGRRDALGVSDAGSVAVEAIEDSEVLLLEVPMQAI